MGTGQAFLLLETAGTIFMADVLAAAAGGIGLAASRPGRPSASWRC